MLEEERLSQMQAQSDQPLAERSVPDPVQEGLGRLPTLSNLKNNLLLSFSVLGRKIGEATT